MNARDQTSRNPEPIQLGHGAVELEIFLEPTCPFSKRAFAKLQPLLSSVGESELTINIRILSQPWHLFSPIVCRCIVAASATEGGRVAGLKALDAVFENREEFVCEDHCAGPNLSRSPSDIVRRISQLSGVDFSGAFELDSVTSAVKWHTKYARQNGVHSTPSFAVNGLLNDSMSSGQSVEEWAELLGLKIE
jgi:protein-disulfide isomerase